LDGLIEIELFQFFGMELSLVVERLKKPAVKHIIKLTLYFPLYQIVKNNLNLIFNVLLMRVSIS